MPSLKYHKLVFFSILAEPKSTLVIALLLRHGWNSEWASYFQWSTRLSWNLLLLFFSAGDLGEGLEVRPRWAQIKQARLFRDWADETLRITEVRVTWYNTGLNEDSDHCFTQGMLPPDPQIQAGPFRRRIN